MTEYQFVEIGGDVASGTSVSVFLSWGRVGTKLPVRDFRFETTLAGGVTRHSFPNNNAGNSSLDKSPPVMGEIKAFPLACVCLPEHWRKTIEGDGSTGTVPAP